MHLFEAIVLGLVQGLTEFLPISSSAHIRIAGLFFGTADPGAAFTAITQIGTEAAVLVFFWRDIVRIVTRWAASLVRRVPRNDPDARLGWLIIVGSLPIVVLGLLFQKQIESVLRSLWIVAIMLIVFGVLLGIADAVGAKRRRLEEMTIGQGTVFGFAQALALIPGVSRSGGTITAGLFMGFERAATARYAFLLAVPAVFGSGFYQLAKSWNEPGLFTLPETAWATVISFVVALGVIALFMRYISRHSFLPFVIYRVLLGGVLLVLLGAGVVQA
ncbi:undecaprenyl-diphosphate phosphatase [Microbacterium sp. CJ88]|uniref:undecaprenyl-diphosphate phosphatase n=1 Tax=Microbacterium sp. CJ88 TaxID=3445672 RepID=UPI003F65CAFA